MIYKLPTIWDNSQSDPMLEIVNGPHTLLAYYVVMNMQTFRLIHESWCGGINEVNQCGVPEQFLH
jgi:hypothetical protein